MSDGRPLRDTFASSGTSALKLVRLTRGKKQEVSVAWFNEGVADTVKSGRRRNSCWFVLDFPGGCLAVTAKRGDAVANGPKTESDCLGNEANSTSQDADCPLSSSAWLHPVKDFIYQSSQWLERTGCPGRNAVATFLGGGLGWKRANRVRIRLAAESAKLSFLWAR